MKKLSFLATLMVGLLLGTSILSAAGIYGTLDLSSYETYKHDIKASTIALDFTKNSDNQITACSISIFDKKAVEKYNVPFEQAIGAKSVSILAFSKNWCLLQTTINNATNMVYSIKITSSEAIILGEIPTTSFQFRFITGKYIVSYLTSSKTAQLYDKNLQVVGVPTTLIGRPHSLNSGKALYCENDSKVMIYKIKTGFELIIDSNGEFESINEAKRLCCIKDGNIHKIAKY